MIAFVLSDQRSIYQSQVESHSRSPAHKGDYVRDVLTGLQVGQFVDQQFDASTLRPESKLSDVIEQLSETRYHDMPVVDEAGRYLGMVSLEEVHLASRSPVMNSWLMAVDLMRNDIIPLRQDDPLDRALELFTESDRLTLAVVDDSPDKKVVGIVHRAEIAAAYLKRLHAATDDHPA